MNTNDTVSNLDFSRLMSVVAASASRSVSATSDLDEKLANATVVEPRDVQPNVVTMNSKVLLASPAWDGVREYRLIYPPAQPCAPGEVSVLSALGTTLLGARAGARLSIGSGPTARLVHLVGVSYQPEAEGHWDL